MTGISWFKNCKDGKEIKKIFHFGQAPKNFKSIWNLDRALLKLSEYWKIPFDNEHLEN